jgi:hypothetical protein
MRQTLQTVFKQDASNGLSREAMEFSVNQMHPRRTVQD